MGACVLATHSQTKALVDPLLMQPSHPLTLPPWRSCPRCLGLVIVECEGCPVSDKPCGPRQGSCPSHLSWGLYQRQKAARSRFGVTMVARAFDSANIFRVDEIWGHAESGIEVEESSWRDKRNEGRISWLYYDLKRICLYVVSVALLGLEGRAR